MATQKYGKVRIGQLIGSQSGVDFDLWVPYPLVVNAPLNLAASGIIDSRIGLDAVSEKRVYF
jgi:hypothetical protein